MVELIFLLLDLEDFPGGSEVKVVCLQFERPGFDPCVGKIHWRRKWQPTPVFLPGESHGWRSLVGYSQWSRKESDTTEQLHFLSLHLDASPSRGFLGDSAVKNPPASAGDMGSVPASGRSPGGGHCNHASTLAWRTPRTQEPGGPQSLGSQRVEHDRSDLAHTHTGTQAGGHTSAVTLSPSLTRAARDICARALQDGAGGGPPRLAPDTEIRPRGHTAVLAPFALAGVPWNHRSQQPRGRMWSLVSMLQGRHPGVGLLGWGGGMSAFLCLKLPTCSQRGCTMATVHLDLVHQARSCSPVPQTPGSFSTWERARWRCRLGLQPLGDAGRGWPRPFPV